MESNSEDAAKNIMISAYKDEVNKQVVVVMVNMNTAPKDINLSGISLVSGSVKSYTTSGSKNLSSGAVSDVSKITVDGKTIIILVGSYQ